MKNIFRNILQLMAAVIITLVLSGAAVACSCLPPRPVAQKLADSENVVLLKVVSMEKFEMKADGMEPIKGLRSTTLSVEKVFKGALKPGDELTIGQGPGDACYWGFGLEDEGQEYLFYLGEGPREAGGYWQASICSGNKLLKYAAADLYYLEKAAQLSGQTRISGTLSQYIGTERKLLAGKTVRISGAGKDLTLKTDKNGVYEIYGLLPGNYTIEPERIKGYRPLEEWTYANSVELTAKGHVEANFQYDIEKR